MVSSKVYLITGCSSGLGYSLALAALKAGHKVIATSRSPGRTPEKLTEITTLGGTWAALDVASPNLETQVRETILPLLTDGRLDVLINNAGIADGSVVEDIDLENSRAVFDTNFWGPLRLSRVVVPIMRAQGGGSIVNVSTMNAVLPFPLLSVYSASKAALDASTIALSGEVAHFGIHVLLVNPAGIRTPFVQNGGGKQDLRAEYKGTAIEATRAAILAPSTYTIDPDKAAATIVATIEAPEVAGEEPKNFMRLPLGAASLGALQARIGELNVALEKFSEVAQSVED